MRERLRIDGLRPGELAGALADVPPHPGEEPPAWWREAMDAFPPGGLSPVPPSDAATDADLLAGCVRLVAPLARAAFESLTARASVAAGESPPFDPRESARTLSRPLALELASLCRPAVALELQAARIAGGLRGCGPQERAASFLRELGRAERARELFAEHPVLLRLLHERTRLGVDAAAELLERLAADWPRLCDRLLGGADPGAFIEAQPLGDSHEGGRRVLRLAFTGGASIVYKPRSLAGDLAYQRVLDHLAKTGFGLSFRPLGVVTGDGYGWQEWVEPAGCDSHAGVDRYFTRLGAHLATLHALHGIDVHHENLIACGEHPILVDLECLLHPRLGGHQAPVVDPLIAETSLDCVLRVGLLPCANPAFAVDMSGIGRDPAAAVTAEEVGWQGEGSDEVRRERRVVELAPGANAPYLGGGPVRPHEYVNALAAGFVAAHELLCRHREALLAEGGAAAALAEVTSRIILRPSRVYADLLERQASSPAALDDGLAREETLNLLWRGVHRRPDLRRAAAAERHDLWHGDVPRITTRPGSTDGHHHALGALSGLLEPHRADGPECLRRLDEVDRERQLAFLRASVLAAALDLPEPSHPLPALGAPSVEGALAGGVREAARRLGVLALRDGDQVGWLSPAPARGHAGRVLRPLGAGLGEGQLGVALFLAAAGVATGTEAPMSLARAAVRRALPRLGEELDDLGLLSGAGGALWALSHLAVILEEATLLDSALALARQRRAAGEREGRLDLRSGLAGWSVGVAALATCTADAELHAEAQRCADRLMEAPAPAAAGLLDGAAGRGLALLRLGETLGSTQLAGAGAALARQPAPAGEDGSWGTGAGGRATVLAELTTRAPDAEADERSATLLRAALAITRRRGLGRDHAIVTGDLGALDALRRGAAALDDRVLRREIELLAGAVVAGIGRDGPLCSGPGGVEAPGLLTGVAGLGLGCLGFLEDRAEGLLALARPALSPERGASTE